MPASFFYSPNVFQENKFTNLAFEAVMKYREPNFDRFFLSRPRLPPAPGQPSAPSTTLCLVDGAALMCGTPGELDNALNVMKNDIVGFTVTIDREDLHGNPVRRDLMCVHYAMLYTLSDRTKRILVCLAPLRGWWQTPDFDQAGTKKVFDYLTPQWQNGYRKYMDHILWLPVYKFALQTGIQTADLQRDLNIIGHRTAWIEM